MKKPILLILSFCFVIVLNVNAQISLGLSDMPTATKVIYQANDTLPSISVGTVGASQTWNFSTLAQHTLDTSIATNYSYNPNTAFSTSSVVVKQNGQNISGYFLGSSSSFALLGGNATLNVQGTNYSVNQINTPSELVFNFPTSYDSSFTNDYTKRAKFYFGQTVSGFVVDSIRQKSVVHKTQIVDAWGTLTTPMAGGPYNVLRVKETVVHQDTAQAYTALFGAWTDVPNGTSADSTTSYSWWTNGMGAPLATATLDSTGHVVNVQWLTSVPAAPLLSATATSTNVTCHGSCDGTAFVTANWGTPPYTYSWNTSPVQTIDSASNLCVGTYTVTVTDSVNATATHVVTILAPAHPTVTANGAILSTTSSATSFQWYLNDTLISGATLNHYTTTKNGNYTIVTTNNGCVDTSAVYNFHSTGINNLSLNDNISIYPNPATNQITIQFAAADAAKQDVVIDITNELGARIKQLSSKQLNEMVINIADLPAGIYFIKIQNSTNTINKKFIKQ